MLTRRRTGFALVVLTALPLLLVSSIQAAIYIRARHQAASERLAQTASALASRTDDYVDEHVRAVLTIARETHTSAALTERLAQQHLLYPGFLTMLVADRDGTLIAAHPSTSFDGKPVLGQSIADREYFLQPKLTMRPFVSRVFRGRGFGNDVIVAISAPIAGADGRFAGIVEGSLDLSHFHDFAAKYMTASGMKILLLDHGARVISASGTDAYPPLASAGMMASKTPLRKPAIVELGGEWHLLARAASRRGWTIIAGRPLSIIHRASIWSFLVTAIAVLAGLFASFVLASRITERVSRPLRESEKRFREMVEQSFGLICTHDLDGRLLSVNPAAAEVLGYRVEELTESSLESILEPGARPQFDQYLERIKTAGHAEGMMEVVTRSGEKRTWIYRNRLIDEQGRRYVLGHAHDITERRRAERVLMQQALEDPLTGLANRTLFRDRLRHELERAARAGTTIALLYIDLDGFKQINDDEGHAAGDAILHETAVRLRTSVRASDTVARLGGDEFAVILAEPGDEKQAAILAHAILQNLSGAHEYRGRTFILSASIGMSLCPVNATTAESLIEDADDAMYRAKRAGRNRVHVSTTRAGFVALDATPTIDSAV